MIVILAVVGVIAMILISIFRGPPKNSELSSVLANQQEMLRIIDARRESLTTSEGANYVSILRPVLISHGRELDSVGITVLVPINGSGIDAELDEAVRNSRLDKEMVELFEATLKADEQTLEQLNAITEDDSKYKPVIELILEDYSSLVAAD